LITTRSDWTTISSRAKNHALTNQEEKDLVKQASASKESKRRGRSEKERPSSTAYVRYKCEQVPMDRISGTQQIPPASANARSGHPETKDLVSEPKPSSPVCNRCQNRSWMYEMQHSGRKKVEKLKKLGRR
jgi:hypothetical protein